jgi:hypothetical protein
MIYSTKNFSRNIRVAKFTSGRVCKIAFTSEALLGFSGLINANLLYVSTGNNGSATVEKNLLMSTALNI